jgi:hypothetical protein
MNNMKFCLKMPHVRKVSDLEIKEHITLKNEIGLDDNVDISRA